MDRIEERIIQIIDQNAPRLQAMAEDIFTHAKHHPYTDGLFASLPNLKSKTARLRPIAGLMPDPTNLPKGCKFAPRCDKCMEICKEVPPQVYTDGSHAIRCHLLCQEKKD